MSSADLGIRLFLADDASAGLNAFGANLSRLAVLIGRAGYPFSQLSPALQALTVVAAGSGLALGVFASAINFAVTQASNLQDAMVAVEVQVKGATENIGPLTTMLIQLADNSQYTANEVADGFAQLGAHGVTAADLLHTSIGQAMVDLAEAMGENGTTGAAKLLAQTLEEFSAPASDATQYADVLIQAFKNGIPSIASLNQAFAQSSYIAYQLGIPIQTLARYLDVLAQSLGSGSVAGVSMHDMLQSLVAPTNGAAAALGQLGIISIHATSPALQTLLERLAGVNKTARLVADNFQPTIASLEQVYTVAKRYNMVPLGADFYSWAKGIGALSNNLEDANGKFLGLDNMINMFAQAQKKVDPAVFHRLLRDIFSVGGAKAIETLLADIEKTNSKLKSLQGAYQSTGQAAQAAQQKNDTYRGSLNMLRTTIDNIAAVIGGPLAQNLAAGFRWINNLIGVFTHINPATAGVIAKFLVIGTALSAVGLLVPVVVFAFTAFNGIVPIVFGVALAIAALASGITWLSNSWKALTDAVLPAKDAINACFPPIKGVATIGKEANNVGITTRNIFKGIADAFLAIGGAIGGITLTPLVFSVGRLAVLGVQAGIAIFSNLIPALLAFALSIQQSTIVTQIMYLLNSFTIPQLFALAGAWLAAGAAALLAALPYILIGTLIAGMIVGLALLIQHLGGLKFLLGVLYAAWMTIQPALNEAAQAIKGALSDALHQLVPLWLQLVQAFDQAKPALLVLGAVLGGIIAFALGVVIGLIRGLIGALAALVVGAIHIVVSIIQIFVGLVQFFTGLFRLIYDICTGRWSDVGAALQQIGQGIVNIFNGLWGVVSGIFTTAFNVIKGLVSGFVEGFLGFFHHLSDVMVGHSIIPDLVKSIIAWVAMLPGKVFGLIESLVSGILTRFSMLVMVVMVYIGAWELRMLSKATELVTGFVGKFLGLGERLGGAIQSALLQVLSVIGGFERSLFQSGLNLMSMLAQGIVSGIGQVIGAAGRAASSIKALLGFSSPTKEGPLSDSDQYMPNMMKMYANGIVENIPLLQSATLKAAQALQPKLTSSRAAVQHGQYAVAAMSTNQSQPVVQVFLDGKDITAGVLNQVGGQARINGLGRYWK